MTTRATPDREDLRRRFLTEAASAFDLMFSPDPTDDLRTFDQRERRAHDLGQQLALALLQQHANADPAADPPQGQPPLCPHCHKPGRPFPDPDEPFPSRRLTVRDGEVILRRARFRCPACRAVFFPPG